MKERKRMNCDILFLTPVYLKMVKNPQKLNTYLFPLIKAWSEKDKSENKTNEGGGWHSPTNMNLKKEYQPLTDELFSMQNEIFKNYGVEPKPRLGNMWANSGNLFVEDPRPAANLILARRVKKLPPPLSKLVSYPAIEGQIIMFPAWLPHGVHINKSKEKGEKGWRISISFNFIQVKPDAEDNLPESPKANIR